MGLLAESLSGSPLIILGVLLIAVAFLLRRGAVQSRRVKNRDSWQELQRDLRVRDEGHASQIRKMEVRLHDFAREVEGRIDTRLRVLNQLIADADREITQLQELLGQVGTSSGRRSHPGPDLVIAWPTAPAPHSTTTVESQAGPDAERRDQQLVDSLANQGADAARIAAATGLPLARVVLLLNRRNGASQADAA